MSSDEINIHYVSTHEEAKKIIESKEQFFISNCGCREERGNNCQRSKIDVCLQFIQGPTSGSATLRETSLEEARDLMRIAEEKHLVTRPFRNLDNLSEIEGICFCCDDCCGYQLNPQNEVCDKGIYIELTNTKDCTDCGLCVDVCYFRAKELSNGKLKIISDSCSGCGLCVEVCSETCIQMVLR